MSDIIKIKKEYLSKLNNDLDLTSIESGIKETVHWFQNNFQNCRK